MSLDTVKAFITKQLGFARDSYLQDLESMSESDLLNGMGGSERKPIDFSYEVAFVNRRFATRIQGGTPDPWPEGGWMLAPESFRTKQAAIDGVREGTNALIAAWEATPAEEMARVIPLPTGDTSPLDLAFSCCWHNGYHDAQLNYLQELKGDMAMHWED
ncbi:MAG: hypothetical protein GC165_09750 [Armatimonadetes bacterium]|nr:hypothetical protein [Armatimonadota bacterium]MBS1728584.1 DinB family protein [Armatimonadota bacterium]